MAIKSRRHSIFIPLWNILSFCIIIKNTFMKKHLIPFITFTGFICMTAMAWFGNRTFTLGDKTQPYDKLWKRVVSCSNKGLTESAMKIIELIYQKAKAENNSS